MFRALLLLVSLQLLASALPAAAQTVPSMRRPRPLSPGSELHLDAGHLPAEQPRYTDPQLVLEELRDQQRRAGLMIAVGTGVAVAGAVFTAVFGGRLCRDHREPPPSVFLTGGVAMAVGVTFALTGTGLQLGLPSAYRREHRLSASRRAKLSAIGLASASAAFGLATAINSGAIVVGCFSS